MRDEDSFNQNNTEDDFEQMLEASFTKIPKLEPGMKVTGRVTSVGEENVFLDLGTNLDGVIGKAELLEAGVEVQVDDEVECFIVAVREGVVQCTTRLGASSEGRAGKEAAVSSLMDAEQSGIPVEGKVKEVVKGGVKVSLLGLEAFCPISQIDNSYVEDASVFLGGSYLFRVMRVEEDGRNIVISRKSLLQEEAEAKAKELWSTVNVGDTVKGVVTNIRKYGAFVNIGGVEGLLHVSEMSHERVEDPADVLNVGQSIDVAVKSMDQAEGKISLSIKSLQADPWESATKVLGEGRVVVGRVTRLQPFGAFVEVAPGVDGLIHISELGGEKRIAHPREVLSEGQEMDVKILSIDHERKRIALTVAADKEKEEEEKALDDLRAKQKQQGHGSMGTLGDLLSKAVKDDGKGKVE